MKVAETFLAIEALFPERIDLGVCRGPGVTDSETARALVYGRDADLAPEVFAKKAEALAAFLYPSPATVNSGDLHARPLGIAPPPLWVLGAGPTSARLAASLGASYGYSLFFGGGLTDGAGFVADYERLFTKRAAGPRALIAVSVLCADSESLAKQFDAELIEQGCYASNIVGTPKQCARMLKSFAALVGVNEILVASFVSGRRARRELYRQLADEVLG